MKILKVGLVAAVATLPLSASIADAAPQKKKRKNPGLHLAIGQNEALLAETKCGDMGSGNGLEVVRIRKTRDGIEYTCVRGLKKGADDSRVNDADPGKHSKATGGKPRAPEPSK